ncbi:UNVERIFIED_CONTAM: hypothetical protein K2H54_041429 [Gekko kuhli]
MCLTWAFDDTGWLYIFLLCSGSLTVHCATNKHFLFTFPFLFMAQEQKEKRNRNPKTTVALSNPNTAKYPKIAQFCKKLCAVAQMLSPDFFLKVRCAMTCLITTENCTAFFLLKIKAIALHT